MFENGAETVFIICMFLNSWEEKIRKIFTNANANNGKL